METYTPSADQKTIDSAVVTENGIQRSKTEYEYDSYGNITLQKNYTTNTASVDTAYTYHNGALVATKQAGNLTAEQFAYDDMGNLTSHTDAEGNTTAYTYDALGRQTSMTNPDSSVNTTV